MRFSIVLQHKEKLSFETFKEYFLTFFDVGELKERSLWEAYNRSTTPYIRLFYWQGTSSGIWFISYSEDILYEPRYVFTIVPEPSKPLDELLVAQYRALNELTL